MTRKRVRESLGRTLCESCPYCEGKGFVRSPKTLCYEIFRKVTRLAKHGGERIIVTAHPSVADLLSDEERTGIEDIENRHGVKITIRESRSLHQENYEVTVL
jgi:ribonuclease G